MVLGCLVDAGVPLSELLEALQGLPLEGWSMSAQTVDRAGISAVQVRVEVADFQPERHLADVEAILETGDLTPWVRQNAARIFRRLAEAEARVHGVPLQRIHFHEVGAADAILDIVGSLVGLELLGVEQVFVTEFPTGVGSIRCAHGLFPNPAPATQDLLKGFVLRSVDTGAELVTPTGAALLTTLHSGARPQPFRLVEVGYGAGSRQLPFPNVLRLSLGEVESCGPWERVTLLETTLDDLSPEVCAEVAAQLRSEGALDVYLVPVIMKKGRPGVEFRVLCRHEDRERLCRSLLVHTTTLGVRASLVERQTLERRLVQTSTPWGPVRVKVATLPDGSSRSVPEFEDCRRLARETGVPVYQILASLTRFDDD